MADRLPNGHFASGNHLSQGNTLMKKMGILKRRLLNDAADPAKLSQCAQVLYEIAFSDKAKNHEKVAAIKLLYDTFYGKPLQSIDISHDNGRPSGVTMADIQIAILAIKDPQERAKFAQAIRQRRLEALPNTTNGQDDDAE